MWVEQKIVPTTHRLSCDCWNSQPTYFTSI